MSKLMKIKIVKPCRIAGKHTPIGTILELPEDTAAYLIGLNKASADITVDDKKSGKKD